MINFHPLKTFWYQNKPVVVFAISNLNGNDVAWIRNEDNTVTVVSAREVKEI